MNKQHLIALDLDGTLLTDNKIISTEQNIQLQKQRNKDILSLFQQDVHSALVMITIKNLV